MVATLSISFEDLGVRHQETVRVSMGGIKSIHVSALVPGLFSKGNANAVVDDLLDGVGLSSCARLVALDVVTGNKDTIAGDNLAGFEESNIANEQVLDVDDALDSGANNLDATFFGVGDRKGRGGLRGLSNIEETHSTKDT